LGPHSQGAMSRSEVDLVSAVRKAASEAGASSYSGYSGSRRSGSEASLGRKSGRSRRSRSTFEEEGFTLEQQQKAVQDAAFDRYLQDLKQDAKKANTEVQTWKTTVKGGLDEEQNEKARKKELCSKNQQQIKTQMEHNKDRRAESRREWIEAASSHSFPLFTETFISLPEVEEYQRNQKIEWRKELDAQMVTNKMLQNIELKKFRDQAKVDYTKNVKTMSTDRRAERERLVNQGKDLVNNWERDIRLKDIKKGIEVGKDCVRELENPGILGRQRR